MPSTLSNKVRLWCVVQLFSLFILISASFSTSGPAYQRRYRKKCLSIAGRKQYQWSEILRFEQLQFATISQRGFPKLSRQFFCTFPVFTCLPFSFDDIIIYSIWHREPEARMCVAFLQDNGSMSRYVGGRLFDAKSKLGSAVPKCWKQKRFLATCWSKVPSPRMVQDGLGTRLHCITAFDRLTLKRTSYCGQANENS